MLSFVQLLILQGGKESPQFEATFLIAAKPTKHRIATRHVRIEAKICGARYERLLTPRCNSALRVERFLL
jgi:hypothetical protein